MRNEPAGAPAVVQPIAGAPDFPLGTRELERVSALELNVAKLARRKARKEVQQSEAQVKFFEGRKELAKAHSEMNKTRLKKAAKNVRAHELAHEHAASAVEDGDESDGDLGHTPPPSPPAEDIVDLTADEADN